MRTINGIKYDVQSTGFAFVYKNNFIIRSKNKADEKLFGKFWVRVKKADGNRIRIAAQTLGEVVIALDAYLRESV